MLAREAGQSLLSAALKTQIGRRSQRLPASGSPSSSRKSIAKASFEEVGAQLERLAKVRRVVDLEHHRLHVAQRRAVLSRRLAARLRLLLIIIIIINYARDKGSFEAGPGGALTEFNSGKGRPKW